MSRPDMSRAAFLARAAAGLAAGVAALFGGAAAAKPALAKRKAPAKTAYTMVVLSNPKPGREAEFNAWYDDHHLPQVLQVPGIVSAQRFELATDPAPGTPAWRYYSAYQLDTDDPKATVGELIRRFTSGKLTPGDAMQNNYSAVFKAMGPPIRG